MYFYRLLLLRGVLIIIFAFFIFALHESQARTFTLIDGKTIEGQIYDYDLRSDRLVIRTNSGRQNLKAEKLNNDSYRYVQNWDAARQFSNPDKFRTTIYGPEKQKEWIKYIWMRRPGKQEPNRTHVIDFNRYGYDLKIINETGHDLEDIKIKYCIFYKQERMDHWKEEKVEDIIIRPCLETISIFPNEFSERITLKSVVLRDVEIGYERTSGDGGWVEIKEYLEGDGRFLKSDFVGMIMRIELKGPDGNIVRHENRYPKELSEEYVWLEPTNENIVWDDDNLDDQSDTVKPPTPYEEMGGSNENEEE